MLGVFYTMEHSKLQETVCFTGELVAVFLLAHHSALLPEPVSFSVNGEEPWPLPWGTEGLNGNVVYNKTPS